MAIPLAEGGRIRFESIASQMPGLLETLCSASPLGWQGGSIPNAAGIYLLSEGLASLYIGQTRNVRRRIRQHGGTTSDENQASFAFLLAREMVARDHPHINLKLTRRTLAADTTFGECFRQMRKRVSEMEIRFVAVPDPELRTIFEVYAAILLATQYNSFETH